MKQLTLLLLFIPTILMGQDVIWNNDLNSISVGDKVSIYEDREGHLNFEEVRSFKKEFTLSESNILSLGYTDSYFWLRINIHNNTSSNAILELAQAGLPDVEYYYVSNDTLVSHYKAGYNVALDEKYKKSSYQAFPIPPGKGTCYIRLNSNSEPIPIHIHSIDSFELESNKKKFAYGIYLGLMIFVALNSIFLFISLRRKLYLFYALIVIMYISYSAAVIDGFIVYFISKADIKFLYTTIPSIGIVLQTIYCLVFLEVKKYSPKLFSIVKGFVIYFAIWMIAKFFFSFPTVQPINTINALISFFIMGSVGTYVGKKGNKMGYYFALAYFIYFFLVVIQAVYINTGNPKYLGGLSYVAYATLIEAFLLSFLLSRRFEWEKSEIEKEKFDAQQKVIETTRENEQIIERQKEELEKQVADRTAMLEEINEELMTSNERLVDLNREKDGLINVVAHDLRSPLCTIEGYIQLIERDGSLNTLQHNYLNIIDNVTGDGMQLIDDLLDVHSMELDQSTPELSEIKLIGFLTEWQKKFELTLLKKNQRLELNIETNNSTFKTDPKLLTRILNNLMSNATKFSDRDKTIFISTNETNLFVDISIRDEGPGISAGDQEKLFKRFQKLSNRPTDGESSNGLGLSIVKALCNKLNAKILVESQLGTGTSFTVRFPKN